MNSGLRIIVELALAAELLLPAALAQKPPATPPPRSTPPSHAPTVAPSSSQPGEPVEDLVMFLLGRVATGDGTPVPSNVMVERVCNARVRQQVYATSHGDFSMDLGAKTNSVMDASGDGTSQYGEASKTPETGIPRRELANCELRALVSGFRSDAISLVGLNPLDRRIDVGSIVMQRLSKVEGMTLSATPYKAPRDARSAYEKGLEAKSKGNLASARQYFEKAVDIYPKYTNAWFQLGTVLQKEKQKDAARTAYIQATTIDNKFLPPYLSLASMAYDAENWPEVLNLTGHILDLDPMNYAHVTGYILDLDPFDYAEAYYYNSVANYNLNRIEDAEKSGRKAEYLDVRPRLPRVHLVLAEIYARKHNYASAISEIRNYLELVPHARDADQIRERLAELEKLNGAESTTEKNDHN